MSVWINERPDTGTVHWVDGPTASRTRCGMLRLERYRPLEFDRRYDPHGRPSEEYCKTLTEVEGRHYLPCSHCVQRFGDGR
jgi:hypothetical protein